MATKRDRTRPLPAGLTAKQIEQRLRSRKAAYKWANQPPGMSAALVRRFEERIRAGKTYTDLTQPRSRSFMVPASRFRKHCELKPEWGAAIRKLGRINVANKLARNSGRGRQSKRICLNGLHPMKGRNVMVIWHRGRKERRCRACHRAAMPGKPMTPEMRAALIAAMERGETLAQFLHGRPVGGGPKDRSLVITTAAKFYHQRKIDPEFARIVDKHIPVNKEIGQTLKNAKDAPPEMKPALINLARLRHKIKTVRRR